MTEDGVVVDPDLSCPVCGHVGGHVERDAVQVVGANFHRYFGVTFDDIQLSPSVIFECGNCQRWFTANDADTNVISGD